MTIILTRVKMCDIIVLWTFENVPIFKKHFNKGGVSMKYSEIEELAKGFETELKEQEKAPNTIKAYLTDIAMFREYSNSSEHSEEITKSDIIAYREKMKADGVSTSTINRRIISINKFLKWAGAADIANTRSIKQQTVTDLNGVITFEEFERMSNAALHPGKQAQAAGLKPDLQAWAIMQTLYMSGIRFGELKFFTVEALKDISKNGNSITVENKGKLRKIPVSKELYKLLRDYCSQQGITKGYIFGTRNGTPISNEQISRRLKKIAGYARISKSKIHPHSFRHLFGVEFMEQYEHRIDVLADILGHSSINTTRIYTRISTKEQSEMIDGMNLKKNSRKRTTKKD